MIELLRHSEMRSTLKALLPEFDCIGAVTAMLMIKDLR
jgi:hypothetical protein